MPYQPHHADRASRERREFKSAVSFKWWQVLNPEMMCDVLKTLAALEKNRLLTEFPDFLRQAGKSEKEVEDYMKFVDTAAEITVADWLYHLRRERFEFVKNFAETYFRDKKLQKGDVKERGNINDFDEEDERDDVAPIKDDILWLKTLLRELHDRNALNFKHVYNSRSKTKNIKLSGMYQDYADAALGAISDFILQRNFCARSAYDIRFRCSPDWFWSPDPLQPAIAFKGDMMDRRALLTYHLQWITQHLSEAKKKEQGFFAATWRRLLGRGGGARATARRRRTGVRVKNNTARRTRQSSRK